MPAVLEGARLIAQAFDSYMEGFAVRPSPGTYVTVEPVSSLAISGAFEPDTANEAKAAFEAFMQAQKVPLGGGQGPATYSYAWPRADAAEDAYIGSYGRVFDLIVLGRPGSAPENPRMPPLESALFDAGRPVLIVPKNVPKVIGRNVLVSWNRSTEQAHTNAFAMPILQRADKVTVLMVEGGTTTGPSAEDAALHLRRNGVKAEALTLKKSDRNSAEAIGDDHTGESRIAGLRSGGQKRLYAKPPAANDLRRRDPAYSGQRHVAGADGPLRTRDHTSLPNDSDQNQRPAVPAGAKHSRLPHDISVNHAADVSGDRRSDDRRHRVAGDRRGNRRGRARVVDCCLVSDCRHDRRADLWPARRQLRPPQSDVLCALAVHGGVGAVRCGADHRTPVAGACAARAWRRRPDDVVAGAGRRDDPAARTGALSGLSRHGGGLRQYIRPDRRRFSHRAFRLAVDFSGQSADRLRCHVFDDASCPIRSSSDCRGAPIRAG